MDRITSPINEFGEKIINSMTGIAQNRYTLSINGLNSPISILEVKGNESINQPWCYTITFTSSDASLSMEHILNQPASFTFNPITPKLLNTQIRSLSDLPTSMTSRTLFGVITAFRIVSVSKEQFTYQINLSPRVAKLNLGKHSAIYQNQSVITVVESLLRQHGLTGIDYRLELTKTYAAREFITQWQESDLAFIQRLLADVGIWFRFETHAEHNCDVLVLGDNEQGYDKVTVIDYKPASSLLDGGADSVWDVSLSSKMVASAVQVNDYNYQSASANLVSQINSQPKDQTTYGVDYRYDEHYEVKNNDNLESGEGYARLRHEQAISEQVVVEGKSNRLFLSPGQLIHVNGLPLTGLQDGLVILTVEGKGSRRDDYQISFTAIPFNLFKPYRPAPIHWPRIQGTLTAHVTSPNNDTYGYIDTQGRYRVKFNVDLHDWKVGNESLWVRLARPYAGNSYGFHFPLIDGTEVAIAFMNGNPDRPYIAHALHNSEQADLVSTINKHRNVIRTPANNKLRMDDKRGEEHIKLATEYGKTQLNLGHLVDQDKQDRGQGFELRTDEWGAIRSGKGLYITSEEQSKADNIQLQMDNAIKQLEQSCEMVKRLNELAEAAKAELADLETQKVLLQNNLRELAQPAIVTYAPSGLANVTPSSIQLTAGDNLIQTAQNTIDINAFKRFMVTAGNMISLFANKMGIKIFASKGKIDIQAQNDEMLLTSRQNMVITSSENEVIITANKKLTLTCGEAAIIFENGNINVVAPGDIKVKTSSFGILEPANYQTPVAELSDGTMCAEDLN